MEMKKGYKQTQGGEIPEDWQLVELRNITTEIGDGIHSTPIYSTNGEYFFINGNNIHEGHIRITSDTKSTDYSEFKKHKKNLGDRTLLLSINGTIGNLGVYAGEPVFLGKSAAYMNVEGKVSKSFIYYYLQTAGVKHHFDDGLTGTTIKNLGLGTIRNTPIALPPTKAEQTAIATVLSDADALIESLERLIVKKRNVKQGAMQQLLTGKKRLPGFSGKWTTKKLGKIAEIYQPVTISQEKFTEDGYLVYGANGIVGRYDKYNHETWQTTITCRGSTCGTVNKTVDKCWITGNAMVINVDSNKSIDKLFIYYLLSNHDFKNCITGSGQPQIVRTPLAEFEFQMPPTGDEQTAIATILSDMDAEIKALERKLNKYKMIKQGMMQELLTGKTRLI